MKEVVGRRQGTRDGVARVRVAGFSLTAHGVSRPAAAGSVFQEARVENTCATT